MRILITGGRGYLGSVLVPLLLARGHEVVSLERPSPFPETVAAAPHPRLVRRTADILDPGAPAFDGVDAVICLAAVPNRADRAHRGGSAWDVVNRDACVGLARAARTHGVRRFLFASSCSVYGSAHELAGEDTPLAPLTPYAVAKAEAERRLALVADAHFSVVSLRLATLFGSSPRLRYDLLVNAMVREALTRNEVEVPEPGLRRSLLHVRDAADAFLLCLPDPRRGTPPAATFNVTGLNTTTDRVARFVAGRIGVPARLAGVADDARSYWAANRRFAQATGKSAWRGLGEGVDELRVQMTAGHAGVAAG